MTNWELIFGTSLCITGFIIGYVGGRTANWKSKRKPFKNFFDFYIIFALVVFGMVVALNIYAYNLRKKSREILRQHYEAIDSINRKYDLHKNITNG